VDEKGINAVFTGELKIDLVDGTPFTLFESEVEDLRSRKMALNRCEQFTGHVCLTAEIRHPRHRVPLNGIPCHAQEKPVGEKRLLKDFEGAFKAEGRTEPFHEAEEFLVFE